MTHSNPIIRAFDELLEGNRSTQERVKAVTDAYQAADLDARVQFVESLSEKAFDFLEDYYGQRRTAHPWAVPPPLPPEHQAAPETQVAECERIEAVYKSLIETRGEDVAGNVLGAWRDELGAIRLRLEKARAAIADTGDGAVAEAVGGALEAADNLLQGAAEGLELIGTAHELPQRPGEPVSLEVEAKLYSDSIALHGEAADPEVLAGWQERLAQIREELDAGAEHPHLEDAAANIADVVEADNAGEQLREPPTEGEGVEASLPDGTLATEEDGTPLETLGEDGIPEDIGVFPPLETPEEAGDADEGAEKPAPTRHVSVDHKVTHRDGSGEEVEEDASR